jgi:hypothetical protein
MHVRLSLLALSFLSASLSAPSLRGAEAEPWTLEVRAGDFDRAGTPVSWQAPEGWDAGRSWRLVRAEGGGEVPVQYEAGERRFYFVLEERLAAGADRKYRLEPREPKAAAEVEVKESDGKHLLFALGGKSILRYNYGLIEPPAGIGPEFARSGYIHPLWTPAGTMVTNDFPPNHKHHHGIWFPWTHTEFEGRHVDFWNSGEKEGKIECVAVDGKWSGPVFGGFRARHRFLDLRAPGGPKPVLDELWEVRVWASGERFLVDLDSTQKCAGESPLVLKEYRYGGFGFRGSGAWEGEDRVEYLTSEGKTRKDGHGTRARWCEMSGRIGAAAAAVAFLSHPQNFRAPQPMRIHPSEPFFNFAPCQAGDFTIRPGEAYVSRYRIAIGDRPAGAGEAERLWQDYADPPEVSGRRGAQ